MSVRRSIIVLGVLALVLPVVYFAARAARSGADAPAATLEFATVGRGSVDLTVSAVGRFEANQEANVSLDTGGRVIELAVSVGDPVRAGDVLLRVDDAAQQLALEQAQVALSLAENARARLLAGPDDAQITAAQASVLAAQGAANAASSAVSEADIQAARLAYEAAQQALTDAQTARSTASGGQPQAAYDLTEARIGEASFNAEIARLQLEQLQAGSPAQTGAAYAQVAAAQAQLDQIMAGPREAELAQAENTVAQAQIRLDTAQRALDDTVLRAPFDGVVTQVVTEMGALALPGLPLVTIADLDPLRLDVQVDEIDVREIREGMQAAIRLDALPDLALEGTLDTIAVVGDDVNGIVNYDVSVRLDTPDERARVGMTAEADFVVQRSENVLVVPNAYIRVDRAQNRAFVNRVLADGTLQETEVVLGLQGPDVSEVVSGIEEGDRIAVDLSGDNLSLFGG